MLRSDKEVERLDDKNEARADGGRRFQREGPATEKDLDLAIVVLVRGTKSSRLSKERRGRRDETEIGNRMASQRYLGATPIWALRTIRRTFYSMRLEIGSQWRSAVIVLGQVSSRPSVTDTWPIRPYTCTNDIDSVTSSIQSQFKEFFEKPLS